MASEMQSLNVLSAYLSDHNGYLPRNPNKLISYSCTRCDLQTLSNLEAKNIINIYQKNLERLKRTAIHHRQISYKDLKKKKAATLPVPHVTLHKYNDVNDMSDTDHDDDDAESVDMVLNAKNIRNSNDLRKCGCMDMYRKTTKKDIIVFIVWIILMSSTLFGVGFGLIRIGFGIDKFRESTTVSEEMCSVHNYTKTDCEYKYENQMYNDYQYDYVLIARSKCNNVTLYRRNGDKYHDQCGIRSHDIDTILSCFVIDCGNKEYSFVGFDDLSFSAKVDIELGCIVLIVTLVPFITFICWVSFCYRCG